MTRDLEPGTVAYFSDGQKAHSGIILSLSQDKRDAWTLFLTSNPLWNRKARQATKDEIALCGFPQSRETFLAPVVRPVLDASASDVKYPDARVADLKSEFGPDPFAPLIFTLPADIYPPSRIVKPQMPKKHLHDYIADEIQKKVPNSYRPPDGKLIESYLHCKSMLPRSELRRFVSAYSSFAEFFCRRASVTMSLQVAWERTGSILAEHLDHQKIPRKLLAARMGLSERDILAFETGLQCPSYQEMLTISALLPDLPDEWSLPCSSPLLSDCVSIAMVHNGWTLSRLASVARIPYDRIQEIIVMTLRPTGTEMQRLRTICRELPPWRAYWDELDGLVDLGRMLSHARKGSGR